MMFLWTMNDCSSPDLIPIMSAVRKILQLIQIIAPILLMVMAVIHLIRLIKDPEDKKGLSRIKNSLLAAAILFFIPMLVDVLMNVLGTNFTISSCWNSAKAETGTPSYIDPYEQKKTKTYTDPSQYEKGTPKIVADPGVSEGAQGGITYYVYVPKNATAGLPLFMWLHGDGGSANNAKNNPLGANAEKAGYPAIVVSPHTPNLGSTGNPGWYEGGHLGELKKIIDEVCSEYQCDLKNINIGGHSRGAIGTWMMVSQYPGFFHAAAPVSCCKSSGFHPESFTGVKVWAMRGSGAGSGSSNDDTYANCMQSSVNAVKPYAKTVQYTILPNTSHGGAGSNAISNTEMIRFVLSD